LLLFWGYSILESRSEDVPGCHAVVNETSFLARLREEECGSTGGLSGDISERKLESEDHSRKNSVATVICGEGKNLSLE
jgi:hypothetical protein